MKINTGTYSSVEEANEYLSLIAQKYSGLNGYDYFMTDLLKALNYTIYSKHQSATFINVTKKGKMRAHTLLVEDTRLLNGEALFGFFECENNIEVLHVLWGELSEIAGNKSIQILKGPINSTIWHQYRVIKYSNNQYSFFNSEPLSMPWYYKMLKSLGPVEEVDYYSGRRDQFGNITELTKPSYEKLLAEGYRFHHTGIITLELVKTLHRMSYEIFRQSWGFCKLDEQDFRSLYSDEKIDKHAGELYLAHKGDELVGFCSTVRNENCLIMKTIGIIPQMQGKGIGNALVYMVHHDAMIKGISGIIYALIRDVNKIRFFPKDDVTIFREYACFTFKLDRP